MIWSTTEETVIFRVRYCCCAGANAKGSDKGNAATKPAAPIMPGSPEDPCSDYAYAMAAIRDTLLHFPEAREAIELALQDAEERWERRPRA
jgi:hypothetical protein